MNWTKNQKKIRRRLLELIYQDALSHIGSSMSVIDIIDIIYKIKKSEEKFVLSNGHAAAALYTILEKNGQIKNPKIKSLGVHPDRSTCKNIDVSTGSLGQGLTVATGMALADKDNRVFCLVSDGECAEGSIWEAIRFIYDEKITNLYLIVSVNGWGAYGKVLKRDVVKRLRGFTSKMQIIDGHNQEEIERVLTEKQTIPTIILAKTTSEQMPFLSGLDAHYYTMKENDYKLAMSLLK